MKNHAFILLFSLGLTGSIPAMAQSTEIDKYLDHLPIGLNVKNTESPRYRLTIDWINKDIDGKMINHNLASGIYSKGLEDDTTRWSDLTLTEFNDGNRNEQKLNDLKGLKYKIIGDNMTKADFYKDFPPNRVDLIRWLVQDVTSFEIYGLMFLDSLKLNTPYYPDFFRNQQIKVENYVNFTSKSLNITWTGLSKVNNKLCDLIHYQAMYNPIDADNDAMKLSGRSCYWGDIWVSTDNRQVEFATMNEDLVFKMLMKSNQYEQRINLQREVKLEKVE